MGRPRGTACYRDSPEIEKIRERLNATVKTYSGDELELVKSEILAARAQRSAPPALAPADAPVIEKRSPDDHAVIAPAVEAAPTIETPTPAPPVLEDDRKEDTMPKADDRIYIAEAAELLGIGLSGVRDLAQRGRLPSKKEGPHQRSPLTFLRSDVLALIEERKNGGPRPAERPKRAKANGHAAPPASQPPDAANDDADLIDEDPPEHLAEGRAAAATILRLWRGGLVTIDECVELLCAVEARAAGHVAEA